MSDIKLLPCPFCGGGATLHPPHADIGAWVSCKKCGLEGPTETGITEADAASHWNHRAALSSVAVAERGPVVAAWQFKHYDPISGHPVWKTTLYWNGHRATEYRPLYLDPPPVSELEAENARLRSELEYQKKVSADRWETAERQAYAFDDMRIRAEAAEASLAEALKAYAALVKRFTPKPIRYAPKDRLIIGVERPPLEKTSFFYDVIWSEEKKDFMTASWPPAYNGATHFLDPEKMIGIVWPREKAAARRVREGGKVDG